MLAVKEGDLFAMTGALKKEPATSTSEYQSRVGMLHTAANVALIYLKKGYIIKSIHCHLY